jgi:hypothetical protein
MEKKSEKKRLEKEDKVMNRGRKGQKIRTRAVPYVEVRRPLGEDNNRRSILAFSARIYLRFTKYPNEHVVWG